MPDSHSRPIVQIRGATSVLLEQLTTTLKNAKIDVVATTHQPVQLVVDLSKSCADASATHFRPHPESTTHPVQIQAYIEALLYDAYPGAFSLPLRTGRLEFDAKVLRTQNGDIAMSTLELKLIQYLLSQGGRPVPTDELLVQFWGHQTGVEAETIRQIVQRIRTKIEPNPLDPEHLQTLSGRGYRFCVLGTETRQSPPTSTPLHRLSTLHNLPIHNHVFVGRRETLATLMEALASHKRLITLQGEAGIGKTRLALELARVIVATQPAYDVAWRVDLSNVHNEEQAYLAFANQLQFLPSHTPTRHPLKQIVETLHQYKQPLLLADPCDSALAATSHVISQLIYRCKNLRIVATSREATQLPDEQLIAMGPLTAIESEQLLRLCANEALHACQSDLSKVLQSLLLKLEGNPLAIKLAAQQLSVLSPQNLLRGLSQPLDVLKQRVSTEDSAHQSMRQAIDRSWNQLSGGMQFVLIQLALFPKSLTLMDATTQLQQLQEHPNWTVQHHLHVLHRMALIRLNTNPQTGRRHIELPRFVHAFAIEQHQSRSGGCHRVKTESGEVRWIPDHWSAAI